MPDHLAGSGKAVHVASSSRPWPAGGRADELQDGEWGENPAEAGGQRFFHGLRVRMSVATAHSEVAAVHKMTRRLEYSGPSPPSCTPYRWSAGDRVWGWAPEGQSGVSGCGRVLLLVGRGMDGAWGL